MKRRDLLCISLIVYMLFCMSFSFLWATSANAEQKSNLVFSDIQGHWAQKSINKWIGRGYVGGYPDGTFLPDKNITRAEFIAMVNRVFGYNKAKSVNFKDVSKKDWFAGELAKANAVGYIGGYPDGTVKPNNQINRQEVASILARILLLENTQINYLGKFNDKASIPAWSKSVINTVVSKGYMSGYPDGTFKPEKATTRAEAVAILDRIADTLYNKAGIYGPLEGITTLEGNITINTSGVTLRNTIINGNLSLTEGIGDGHVTLENVQVKGTTKVSGGGVNSIFFINSNLGNVLVQVPDRRKVRLVALEETTISTVEARTDVILEELKLTASGFNDVLVNVPQGAEVQLIGDFEKVRVGTSKVRLKIQSGFIQSLTLTSSASNTVVDLTTTQIYLNNLFIDAPATVNGKGTINYIHVSSKGVNIAVKPLYINVTTGIKATVAGQTIGEGAHIMDTTPPVFEFGYPKVSKIQTTQVDFRVKTNENGKIYYVVLANDSNAPANEQVKAGKNASGSTVSANLKGQLECYQDKEASVTIKGLAASTAYDIYFVAEDKELNLTAVKKVNVTTEIPQQQIPVAPTGLIGVEPTTAENNDGKIIGVNDTMEYKLQANTKWIAVKTGISKISGLVPGTYEVRVKAAREIPAGKSATVIVKAYAKIPSKDAALSDLKVGGITVTGFNSATTTYNIEVPYGTKVRDAVVQVTATKHDPKAADPVITQTSKLPGVSTVIVTAEDGITTKSYTVNFTIAENTAKAITSFNFTALIPEVVGVVNEEAKTITLTVPYGTDVTTLVPRITHTGASLIPASGRAPNFTKPVVYTVTADNGTTADYTVNVTVAGNSDATLTALTINPGTIIFNSGTLTYNDVEVPNGTTSVEVTFTAAAGASTSVTSPQTVDISNGNGTFSVVVTAEDKITKKTYKLNFKESVVGLEG